ncbi:MAG: CDP-alcohol phosphatidyltransferase, partial [bacterium]
MKEKMFAWAVHAYTSLGLVTGLFALRATMEGEMGFAFFLLAMSVIIDATDGPLARRFHSAEVLPGFNGRRLDDIVDYLNYVFVPAFILVRSGLLSSWGWALIPLVSSAYGFSRKDAMTHDGYFTGFPSYWN